MFKTLFEIFSSGSERAYGKPGTGKVLHFKADSFDRLNFFSFRRKQKFSRYLVACPNIYAWVVSFSTEES